MGEQKVKPKSEDEALKEAEEAIKILKDKKSQVSQEQQPGKGSHDDQVKTKTVVKKIGKPKQRSARYQEVNKLVDKNKYYEPNEAISLAKRTSYSKFTGSLEVHIKLKTKKNDEHLRGMINLPHGTGKELKIAVIDEGLIENIAKTGKIDFDIVLATPQMMPKMAKIAKILGPKGKMPSPKAGTITAEPDKTIAEIKKGKIEYRTDQFGIVHQIVGKVSWDEHKLIENLQALLTALPKTKLQTVVICATMGPAIKIKIS